MRTEIATLRLFNEKAERLDQLSFTKFVRAETLGFSMSAQADGNMSFQLRGPDAEATEAFVLTLRFFVQDNEPISIRRMGTLYEGLSVSDRIREQYRVSRDSLNNYLDRAAPITLRGETLTNRRIFDVFLYGGLAHASPEKKKEFDRWAAEEILFGVLQTFFSGILAEMLRFIIWAHSLNLEAIKELEADASTDEPRPAEANHDAPV